MSSPVKTEVTKVLALAVLLILSIGYLPISDTDEHSSSTGDFHVDVNFSSVDSLRLAFVGQVIAPLHARNTLPGYQIGALDLTAPSLIIPIPGNSCIQRQVTALRRIRDLHDLIGGELPVRVLLLSQFDEDATRMKALLLRKAIRPSFELWYSNELTRLSKSILLRQLEPVLLVSNSTVAEVYHAVEHDRIKRAVAEMKAAAFAD
ncbi:MAG: hypothetical protein OXM02_00485 [Bacteroidota bacterium]|nr:hypothetical protein [Bacteroidota bacterium]